MAMQAAGELDAVESVRVSHGAYRPIAFSAAIAETTTYPYDPNLPGRIVLEDRRFAHHRNDQMTFPRIRSLPAIAWTTEASVRLRLSPRRAYLPGANRPRPMDNPPSSTG